MADNILENSAEEAALDEVQVTANALSTTLTEKDMKKVSKKQSVGKVLVQIGLYSFLIFMALVVLFPFYWMVISSLKTIDEYMLNPPTLFPTHSIEFANYAKAFDTANLGTLFINTMIVGVVSTVLSLVITVLSAFAFARLEFKGKNAFFAFLLATMMIPGELFTITNFITVSDFGWTNFNAHELTDFSIGLRSYTVLIVPFLVSVCRYQTSFTLRRRLTEPRILNIFGR